MAAVAQPGAGGPPGPASRTAPQPGEPGLGSDLTARVRTGPARRAGCPPDGRSPGHRPNPQSTVDTSPAPQPQVLLEASELEGRSLPGDVRLEALEGESAEGWLYLATTSDGREVEALVLPANPDGPGPAPSDLVGRVRCRVRAERIEAAARFQHPQVIRILATGVTPEGHAFLVRERPSVEVFATSFVSCRNEAAHCGSLVGNPITVTSFFQPYVDMWRAASSQWLQEGS